MNYTRPDISYVVNRLRRYTHNPRKEHWTTIDRVLKYPRGTMNFGLTYCGFPTILEGYSDANWISNADETKSTCGYIFTLGGGAISWKSSKQTCTAWSTMESKFIALEKVGFEAEWLRKPLGRYPFMDKTISICVATL